MCSCDQGGAPCPRCAGTAQAPRYLEDEGRFTHVPLASPLAQSVRDGEQSECPRCHTTAVDDACDRCGWSLVEQRTSARLRQKERETDWLPRLPLALTLDEYAAADVREDEAA